ncbi:unnamed protein product [Lathyrus sativus]|nr:unnamed protein product [Lathyrus sativus]
MARTTEVHDNSSPLSSTPTQNHEIRETKTNQKLPFYKLFNFADRLDVTLMIIGTIAAVANGLSQPLMTLIFGKLINAFGGFDPSAIVKQVSKVSFLFVYLAAWAGIASFLHQVSCWMVTGERQATRIHSLYLKMILKQDIAFFDTETNTGEVIGRMSGNTILIQDAMGEKVWFLFLIYHVFSGNEVSLLTNENIYLYVVEVSCWMVTGERQATRIHSSYLKMILKQDIAFLDTETNTGEVIGRMYGDTILIQDAMGEKVWFLFLIYHLFREMR